MMRQYQLTAREFGKLRGVNRLKCYTCGRPLKIGQDIATSPTGRKNKLVVRHKDCYERVSESGRAFA